MQHHFAAQKDNALSAWSESELRRFLLSKGIVSPHSKREELELLARQHGASAKAGFADATNTVASAASQASSAVSSAAAAAANSVSETTSSAYYAAANAPALAYDTAAETLQGEQASLNQFRTAIADNSPRSDGRDYVYSTWSDSDLRSYLIEKGLIKSDAKKRRDELLDLIRKPYNDAATNVYDTWSDNVIVSTAYLPRSSALVS